MEEFLNQFLDFVDKGTDWKENNETTNSQVINHFIANNDKIVRELVDKLCESKESSDELGDCNMPRVIKSVCPDCNGLTAIMGTDGIFRPCHCQSQTVL